MAIKRRLCAGHTNNRYTVKIHFGLVVFEEFLVDSNYSSSAYSLSLLTFCSGCNIVALFVVRSIDARVQKKSDGKLNFARVPLES